MTQIWNEKKFKIGLVSISLAKGGVERSCSLLSEMLTQQGHKIHLIVLNDEIDFPYAGKLFNLGKFKKEKNWLWLRLIRFYKLRKYLKKK